MTQRQLSKPQLRSFGLIVASGFTIIALSPTVFHGDKPRLWAVAIAFALCTIGLISPRVLVPVYKGWMTIGEGLGWVNTRVILGLLYYALFVPIGLILRIAKRDAMCRNFDREATSYRIPRTKRHVSHMERPF